MTPPIIAAPAPCFVARFQSTPPTTGITNAAAMSAVKSSTMNCTSSPSPTPASRSSTGTVPTARIPSRSIHMRRSAVASGLIRFW